MRNVADLREFVSLAEEWSQLSPQKKQCVMQHYDTAAQQDLCRIPSQCSRGPRPLRYLRQTTHCFWESCTVTTPKLKPANNPTLNWYHLLLFVPLVWYFCFVTLAQSVWITRHGRSWIPASVHLQHEESSHDGRRRKDLAGLCILLTIFEVCLPFL